MMQAFPGGLDGHARPHVFSIAALFGLAVLVGCGKVESGKAPPVPVAATSDAPVGPVVAAQSDPLVERELTVTESVPVVPGGPVDIVDLGSHSVVVAHAMPKSVAWKPSGPQASIAYPASGVVTFSLSTAQWAAIDKAQGISVHPSGQTDPAEQK